MAFLSKVGGIFYGRHVTYVDGVRKEVRRSFRTRDARVAHRRLEEWEGEIEAERWGARPRLTFDTAATRWLHEGCRALKPASLARYEVSMRQLRPHFGALNLIDIDSAAMTRFEARRRRHAGRAWAPDARGVYKTRVTDQSIRRDFACLSSMMSWAVAMKWIDRNPVPGFLKDHGKHLRGTKARARYLSHAEESRLLAAALTDRNASDHEKQMLHAAIIFAIDTGLRLEEQMSLEWRDVQRGARPYVAVRETKTGEPRKVPLWPRTMRAVVDALPMPADARYVFWRRNGQRYGSMTTAFRAACARAGIEDLTWHDLRRTCGCRLLQDHRMGIAHVSRWLGHKSVSMTERHYAFLGIDNLLDEVERLSQPSAPSAQLLPLRRASG